MLGTEFGAVSAVDALIGVDKNLRNSTGSRITHRRRNGRGGAFRHTDKILGTGIGHYISRKNTLLVCGRALSPRAAIRLSLRGYRSAG